ncbi:hypothetical protein Tcan_17639 [Toxocara canis]|uniref:Uncharacterized protein n=1 Tax=Toxocara canis TaxID=6265 RepID=A0A0B2VBD7_TOXCA|nr:hypothetical protein Tcan_17639 [Toxocara canis]
MGFPLSLAVQHEFDQVSSVNWEKQFETYEKLITIWKELISGRRLGGWSAFDLRAYRREQRVEAGIFVVSIISGTLGATLAIGAPIIGHFTAEHATV